MVLGEAKIGEFSIISNFNNIVKQFFCQKTNSAEERLKTSSTKNERSRLSNYRV